MRTVNLPETVPMEDNATSPACHHEWAVFSTAITEGWLMLQCTRCGLHGTVSDPSEAEWSKAFHAPKRPYKWVQDQRVNVQPQKTTPYVAIDDDGVLRRVPREIICSLPQINKEEAEELFGLIDLVEQEGMDSELFWRFIESANAKMGTTPSPGVANLTNRLKEHSSRGIAYPTHWVSNSIRWYAKEGVLGDVQ